MGLWLDAPNIRIARYLLPKEGMNARKKFVFISTRCCALEPSPLKNLHLPAITPSSPLNAPSQQRLKRLETLELNANRQISYDFRSPDLLQAIDKQNAGSWPNNFAPTATACKLCGHNLGEEVTHPGSEGQAYLLPIARPSAKVYVRVKIFKDSASRAIHQLNPANIGRWVL